MALNLLDSFGARLWLSCKKGCNSTHLEKIRIFYEIRENRKWSHRMLASHILQLPLEEGIVPPRSTGINEQQSQQHKN